MGVATLERYRGCLLAGAVGDALGAPVEFLTRDVIVERFGAAGIREHVEAHGRVGAFTDDTQMTLFTAEGLLEAQTAADATGTVWAAYQRWLVTQDEPTVLDAEDPRLRRGELHAIDELRSRREPGLTCVFALRTGAPEVVSGRLSDLRAGDRYAAPAGPAIRDLRCLYAGGRELVKRSWKSGSDAAHEPAT